MLTAQSCARCGSGGSTEAPSPGGAQRLAGMGCTAFQGCSTQELKGHLTVSPIPAGSDWHHPQLSECWRATDSGSAALDLLWGEVSRLQQRSQKLHQAPGLRDANPAHGRGIHANVLPTECSRRLLIHGTKLLACCHPSQQSCLQAQPETGLGGDRMGRGGPTSTDCSIFRSTAPFILPYTDLSMCSPMCHTWLQKLF